MRSYASIIYNTLALAVPSVLNPLISFFLVLVVSRYMGVEGLGKYSLVLSYSAIFSTLASLGLADLCVRQVARDRSQVHNYLINGVSIGGVASLASVLAMNVVVFTMGYPRDVLWASAVCSLGIPASTAIVFMEATFRALEKSYFVALAFVVENIVRVVACVALIFSGYGIVPLFIAVFGSRIFGMLLMFFYYVKVAGFPRSSLNSPTLRFLLAEAPTFASIAIFSTIHLSVDQIMLSKLQGLEAVGYYSAADRLLSISKTVPVAFSAALLTFFSKESSSDASNVRGLCVDSLRYTAIAICPIVVGTCVLADRFVELLYGPLFVQTGAILRVHMISLIPFSTVYIFAQVLIATDNQRVDLAINVMAAFLNIGLNFVLIPVLGAMGAVVATLVTVIIFNQAQYWYIKRRLFSAPMLTSMWKSMVAASIMGIFTFLLRDQSIIIPIVFSAVVYGVLIVSLRALTREEIRGLLVVVGMNLRKEE